LYLQTKGKAAIDVICNPLGKSGGALIQQFMIIGFGSLAASTPYLGLILLAVVGMWIYAAKVRPLLPDSRFKYDTSSYADLILDKRTLVRAGFGLAFCCRSGGHGPCRRGGAAGGKRPAGL
jgi:hypothetical protein